MEMVRSGVVALLLAVVVLFVFPNQCVSQEQSSSLDTLTVITDFDSKPFSFRKELKPDGFEIDLVQAVAQQLGAKLIWKEMTFDPEIFARCLDTEVADAAIASVTITPARSEMMTFTRPYFSSGQAIAIGEKATWPTGDVGKDLKGKSLGVMDRTTGEAYARKSFKGVEIQAYHTPDSLGMALQAGMVDAIILDEELLMHLASQHSFRFQVVARNLTHEEYGIAVSKRKPEVLRLLNGALAKLGKSGEYTRIYEKWFGKKATLPPADD